MKVSVGIPAYNEAQNIGALLQSLLGQELDEGLSLEEVLVFSDGSTDTTPNIVMEWKRRDKRVELIKSPRRSGKPSAINRIIAQALGDIIVLIDADTMPVGERFLSELVAPIRNDSSTGLAAALAEPLPAETVVGKAAVFSSNFTRRIAHAKPYFGFNVALAIGGQSARKIKLPAWIIGDDAYIFLEVKSQGFKAVVSGARVLYREPQTLRDFIIQRRRYDANITQLERLFGKEFKKYVSIPIKLWLEFFKNWFHDPIGGTLWIILRGFLKLKAPAENGGKYVADRAASTKATFGRRGYA